MGWVGLVHRPAVMHAAVSQKYGASRERHGAVCRNLSRCACCINIAYLWDLLVEGACSIYPNARTMECRGQCSYAPLVDVVKMLQMLYRIQGQKLTKAGRTHLHEGGAGRICGCQAVRLCLSAASSRAARQRKCLSRASSNISAPLCSGIQVGVAASQLSLDRSCMVMQSKKGPHLQP